MSKDKKVEEKPQKLLSLNGIQYDRIIVPLMDAALKGSGVSALNAVDTVRTMAARAFQEDG